MLGCYVASCIVLSHCSKELVILVEGGLVSTISKDLSSVAVLLAANKLTFEDTSWSSSGANDAMFET